jgi:hypothetical protein
MTDPDLFEFNLVFGDVRRVFPLRGDERDTRQLVSAYFAAFRRYPLERVKDGADAWIATGTRFPKPAEWIDAIPKPGLSGGALQDLTPAEAAEHQQAERRGYDGDPCPCAECRAAGVEHRFLRFVPDEDGDGQTRKGRIADRGITRGHWIHGWELQRWYAARDRFWAMCRSIGVKLDDPVLGQPKTLRCMCCKTLYRKGEFACCAPPNGMTSQNWLSLSCPMPDQGGCGKCARHCQCPNKAERIGQGPLAQLGAQFLAEHGR